MKKVLIGFLVLTSFSTFADQVKCETAYGDHNIESTANKVAGNKVIANMSIVKVKGESSSSLGEYMVCITTKVKK